MVKIGLVSVVQPSFWGSSKNIYRNHYLPGMEKLADKLGFRLFAVPKDIVTEKDAWEACRYMNENGVDFILIQCTTFPGGDVILPFAKATARLGLWAVPEVTATGEIPLNSFCGMNMLSSILGQYMDASRPVKWFYGELDSELFLTRLQITLRAMQGLKRLSGAKIGLVGGIAPGFTDFAFDERTTKAKLGVTVDRLPEYGDIKDKALSYSDSEVEPVMADFAADACCVTPLAQKNLNMTARVYKALEELIQQNGYDAIAIGCWPKYRRDLGIVVCGIIGRLLEKGYIAACEGDVDSAASMLLLNGITGGDMPMLMDLSDLNFEDNSALLWHCGSAPKRFSDQSGMKLDGHYKPGSHITMQDDIKVGTVNDMYYRPGEITIARFTWEYEKMMVMTAKLVEKSVKGYDGSRGWMTDFRLAGTPVKIRELMNTILVERYQHHYPVIAGNWENEVMESLAWLGTQPVECVPYRPYLQTMKGRF